MTRNAAPQQSAECSAQFRSAETSGGTAATCRQSGIVRRIRHGRVDTRSDFSNLRLATPVQRVRSWKATMDRLSWISASLDETKGPKHSVHEQVTRQKSRCVLSSHRNGGSTCAKREFVRIPDRHAHRISPAEAARRQPEATQQQKRDGEACRHRTPERGSSQYECRDRFAVKSNQDSCSSACSSLRRSVQRSTSLSFSVPQFCSMRSAGEPLWVV